MIPYDSKGALSPSICRIDHTRPHDHGFPNEDLSSLSFSKFDPSLNNWRLASWAANCCDGQGTPAQCSENRARVANSATVWYDRFGREAGWILGEHVSVRDHSIAAVLEHLATLEPVAPPPVLTH